MKALIASFLLELPSLLIKTVNIVELKNKLKDAGEMIQWQEGRETELTQICENLKYAKNEVEKENFELKNEIAELKKAIK